MVHIVAISDLHGRLPEVPMCDLLLIAGDVCPDFKGTAIPAFRPLVAERQLVWLREVFSPWLTRQPCGHVVMCWGNHDYVGELPGARLPTIDADVLTDQQLLWNGLRIYATPWTYFIPGIWAFDVSPRELAPRMAAIPAGIDVLLTHGPPFGILDRTSGGEHAGSRSLLEAVTRVRPRLHVFGHIHEGRGRVGVSHNVAILDERYERYPEPLTQIYLDSESVGLLV